jgi:hypothetical protein
MLERESGCRPSPILLPKLCHAKAIIDETMLPNEMKDSSASVWMNETVLQHKIKEILPVVAKMKISHRVLQSCATYNLLQL